MRTSVVAVAFATAVAGCSLEGGIRKLSPSSVSEILEFKDPNPSVIEGTTSLGLVLRHKLRTDQDIRYELYDANNALVASGTQTLAAGASSVILSGLPLPADNALDEYNRSYRLVVIASGSRAEANLTVLDNDDPPSVSIADASAVEGTALAFTVTLSAASGKEITLGYRTTVASAPPLATSGVDFTAITGTTLTIPSGSTEAVIAVTSLGDALDEADETFGVALSSPVNVTVVDGDAVGTIQDDDLPPEVHFAAVSQNVTETVGGVVVTVTASLSAVSGQAVTVPYTVGGTATGGGVDHDAPGSGTWTIAAGQTSATMTFTVLDDVISEPSETVLFTLGAGVVNATLGLPSTHTVNIIDNDGPPTLNISDTSVTEGGDLVFTVSLSSASGQAVTFDWAAADGTATTADSDYTTSSGSDVTIAAGATSVTLTVPTGNDTKDEADETLTVTLSDVQNAASGTLTATGTITDNDAAPTVQFASASQASVGESGTLTVQMDLSAVSGKEVVVPVTVDAGSTATLTTDYTLSTTSVTIAAGDSSGSLVITIAGDTLDEDDETVILAIGTPVNATASGQTTHTATITDDDASPTLSIADSSADEGDTLTFTITQSAVSGRDVSFTFNANSGGTATVGTDYTGVSDQVLTITAGQTTVTATVASIEDTLDEANETFDAVISGATNAAIVDASAIGTINDDDSAPTLSIADVTVTEGTGAGTTEAVLTITAASASGQEITVDYATADGTATTAGGDYTSTTGTATRRYNRNTDGGDRSRCLG